MLIWLCGSSGRGWTGLPPRVYTERRRSNCFPPTGKKVYTNGLWVVSIRWKLKLVSQSDWEQLYEAKAAELILYGRALGLSHSEAEDVLHDTFVALIHSERAPRNA